MARKKATVKAEQGGTAKVTRPSRRRAASAGPRPVSSRSATLTPARLEKYLELYANGTPSSEAARKAGTNLTVVSRHKVSDPEFKARHKEAAERFTDHLEAMAERGAVSPMRYGPTLLIFLLKARRPEVYRENHTVRVPELAGFVGAFTRAMERVTSGG